MLLKRLRKIKLLAYKRVLFYALATVLVSIVSCRIGALLIVTSKIGSIHFPFSITQIHYDSAIDNKIHIEGLFKNIVSPANVKLMGIRGIIKEDETTDVLAFEIDPITLSKKKPLKFTASLSLEEIKIQELISGMIQGSLSLNVTFFVRIRFCLIPLYFYFNRSIDLYADGAENSGDGEEETWHDHLSLDLFSDDEKNSTCIECNIFSSGVFKVLQKKFAFLEETIIDFECKEIAIFMANPLFNKIELSNIIMKPGQEYSWKMSINLASSLIVTSIFDFVEYSFILGDFQIKEEDKVLYSSKKEYNSKKFSTLEYNTRRQEYIPAKLIKKKTAEIAIKNLKAGREIDFLIAFRKNSLFYNMFYFLGKILPGSTLELNAFSLDISTMGFSFEFLKYTKNLVFDNDMVALIMVNCKINEILSFLRIFTAQPPPFVIIFKKTNLKFKIIDQIYFVSDFKSYIHMNSDERTVNLFSLQPSMHSKNLILDHHLIDEAISESATIMSYIRGNKDECPDTNVISIEIPHILFEADLGFCKIISRTIPSVIYYKLFDDSDYEDKVFGLFNLQTRIIFFKHPNRPDLPFNSKLSKANISFDEANITIPCTPFGPLKISDLTMPNEQFYTQRFGTGESVEYFTRFKGRVNMDFKCKCDKSEEVLGNYYINNSKGRLIKNPVVFEYKNSQNLFNHTFLMYTENANCPLMQSNENHKAYNFAFKNIFHLNDVPLFSNKIFEGCELHGIIYSPRLAISIVDGSKFMYIDGTASAEVEIKKQLQIGAYESLIPPNCSWLFEPKQCVASGIVFFLLDRLFYDDSQIDLKKLHQNPTNAQVEENKAVESAVRPKKFFWEDEFKISKNENLKKEESIVAEFSDDFNTRHIISQNIGYDISVVENQGFYNAKVGISIPNKTLDSMRLVKVKGLKCFGFNAGNESAELLAFSFNVSGDGSNTHAILELLLNTEYKGTGVTLQVHSNGTSFQEISTEANEIISFIKKSVKKMIPPKINPNKDKPKFIPELKVDFNIFQAETSEFQMGAALTGNFLEPLLSVPTNALLKYLNSKETPEFVDLKLHVAVNNLISYGKEEVRYSLDSLKVSLCSRFKLIYPSDDTTLYRRCKCGVKVCNSVHCVNEGEILDITSNESNFAVRRAFSEIQQKMQVNLIGHYIKDLSSVEKGGSTLSCPLFDAYRIFRTPNNNPFKFPYEAFFSTFKLSKATNISALLVNVNVPIRISFINSDTFLLLQAAGVGMISIALHKNLYDEDAQYNLIIPLKITQVPIEKSFSRISYSISLINSRFCKKPFHVFLKDSSPDFISKLKAFAINQALRCHPSALFLKTFAEKFKNFLTGNYKSALEFITEIKEVDINSYSSSLQRVYHSKETIQMLQPLNESFSKVIGNWPKDEILSESPSFLTSRLKDFNRVLTWFGNLLSTDSNV